MIFQLFFSVFTFIISALIALLPAPSALPGGISSAVDFFVTYVHPWGAYIPLGTLFTIVGLIVVIEASLNVFSAVEFVYNKFRGSGS